MKLLIDSHALIWAADDPARIGQQAECALRDPANELWLSAATIWEVAIKVGLTKLVLTLPFREWMNRAIADLGLQIVPLTVEHAAVQSALPWHHRDPFDRALVAQAIVEHLTVVSCDTSFDAYNTARIW